MNKIIIASLVMLVATPALADHRRHHHHKRSHNNELGLVLGIIGLGIGGAYLYNQNRNVRQCHYEHARDAYGRIIYDRYGNPIRDVVCQ